MSESQEYTTAVIVAVPATDDPVHEFVTEDAHITLQFMGEADDLPIGAAEQIQVDLATLAAALYPFPAKVSGTAILGKDSANVLLIESDPLTKLREILGNTEVVAEACESVEQFPNWIPHLTLAYPDDDGMGSPVTNLPVDTVTIGGLSLWLGGDKYDFPFAKAAPGPVEEDIVVASAITAALGEGKFDPSLHPRGADGQFIEKFGIVKFLTSGSWNYGKVTGISKDAHDQVKIEVTPSDLSGKATGAPQEMLSKQLYKAPKAKAHLTTTAPGVQKIGGQGGSNPGGLYTIPVAFPTEGSNGTPDKYYVKKPKSKSHGQNEALANDLYAEAGVPVPEVDLHADGQLYSKIVDGQQDMAQQMKDPAWASQVQKNFAVDAWLGNRDVFGMTYDNILTDANGTPWRIDNGGALLYRAMGEKKTDFGGKVSELDAFRLGKKSAIYGPSMSKADELDGAQRVLAISPARIEEMVSEAGLPKSLADTLKARRAYIADYYGLTLPESVKPDGAQDNTSAPLVDAPDLAASKGKKRDWFKAKLSQVGFLLQAGDTVEFDNGDQVKYGVDGVYSSPLSIVGAQAQLMGWQQEHGADADVMFKKSLTSTNSFYPRPDHGAVLSGADLAAQNWQRGDKVELLGGDTYKIIGANPSTGAVLVQTEGKPPWLLDTQGVNSSNIFTVKRWDPPAKETPVEDPTDSLIKSTDAKLNEAGISTDLNVPLPSGDGPSAADEVFGPAPTPTPAPVKTGQAAQAEAAIKNDLVTPLPTGNGPAAPKPDQAPAVSGKGMLIGDGTEAQPGAQLVSNKDGKTYTFLKKKGQYAVVTDPNGDDPSKGILKLASTMTQPGATPSVDTGEIQKPKAATGEVPALGMMAVSKDGHAGEITLISPDGKFVFITDANGTRKRKSTGTVSITSGAATVVDTPKKAPGPVKEYSGKPSGPWKGEEKVTATLPTSALNASNMVHVGYADGSHGLEPYTGQPIDALETNTAGDVLVFGAVDGYMGPISASQLAQAEQAATVKTTYQVIFNGNVFFADGTTGPSGGLVLWYASDYDADVPGDNAWELSGSQILNVIATEDAASTTLVMPDGIGFQAADEYSLPASPAPLYGDEAKTLAELKGSLAVGSEISLDGQNWMSVTDVKPSGAVTAMSGNGQAVFINPWSSATYVVKAPPMTDADAAPEAPAPHVPEIISAQDVTSKPANELVKGDVVMLNGQPVVLSAVSTYVQTTFLEAKGQEEVSVHKDWEPEYLGNIHAAPVEVNIHSAFPLLESGSTIDVGETSQLTVLSYPQQVADGSWWVAAIETGKPETPFMVPSTDFGPNVSLPVQIGPWKSHTEMGVDISKVDALFEQATVVDTTPPDHNWDMAQAGIPFGTAQYPIFFSGEDNLYYRQGPTGLEKWDTGKTPSAWTTDGGSTAGMDKVWDGAPFQGDLKIPAGSDLSLFGAETANYKPQPGEAVGMVTLSSGTSAALVVSPDGVFGPGHNVHTVMVKNGELELSGPYAYEAYTGNGETISVLHDPFSEASTEGPALTHHEGPQPPDDLGAKLQALGFTPEPGQQFFFASTVGIQAAYLRQPDGSYKRIMSGGDLSKTGNSLEDLIDPDKGFGDSDWNKFTYTYVPEGAEGPTTVQGLPDGFAPFVPGQGQSVLTVKLSNGITTAYVQSQPGASWYLLNSDGTVSESMYAAKSDFAVQQNLAAGHTEYQLLYGGEGDKAVTFSGYTPKTGEKVFQESNGSHWVFTPSDSQYHPVKDDGTIDTGYGLNTASWGNPPGVTQVWPTEDATPAAPAAEAKTFGGYTPKPGEAIVQVGPGTDAASYYVQTEPGGNWKPSNDLTVTGVTDSMVQSELTSPSGDTKKVWPVDTADSGPSPVMFGYQTKPGDSVVQMVGQTGFSKVYVKPAGASKWNVLDGETGQFSDSVFDQDTIEYGSSVDGITTNVLMGELTGSTAAAQSLTEDKYAGVKETTALGSTAWKIEFGAQVGGYVTDKINAVTLQPGESAWLVDGNNPYVRSSTGEWSYVYSTDGQLSPMYGSDAEMEQTGFSLSKITFSAPAAAPVQKVPYSGPAISGWQDAGLPDPASFSAITDPSQGKGAKAGSWIFVDSNTSGVGLFVQLKTDWDGTTQFNAGKVFTVTDGKINSSQPIVFDTEGGSPWNWVDANSHYISGDPIAGTSTSTGPGTAPAAIPSFKGYTPLPDDKVIKTNGGFFYVQAAGDDTWKQINSSTGTPTGSPVNAHVMKSQLDAAQATQVWPIENAPSTPVEAPAPAPVLPSYPGAQAPSQEDINAWGGSLTKDGHIPTSGMFVTGKGPMSGKIVSVSKDKTKAVVLTGDGKKTTRLIEALKVDQTANYQAYVAPAAPKDIPAGMPIAVDTPAEALAKTIKDGKFRAILSGHPGVSQGQMTVTKATGPSGKAYNRVHLTLTPAQRTLLLSKLSGTGEKGDWATSSKMSDKVAVGDQLPMRLSSTNNPDGSPRWKVDPAVTPPTHTVSKVEDDPATPGIKIVTMTNNVTGETITSRFHPGKSLTTYAWDPNKPKAMSAGQFSLSPEAKAKGWQLVNDGGFSAATGGASDAKLYNEPGTSVTKSAMGQVSSSWQTLRNVSASGVVIETIDPKGSNKHSSTGVTVLSIPEGLDEKALGGALSELGIDYTPMTQDGAKTAVRGLLRTLVDLDMNDVDTAKHYSDELLFTKAGKTIGISDLGWNDVLMAVDESSGKLSYFWSDRARSALATKAKYNLVYRAASTANSAQIVSTVKYGSASSVMKKTTGMLDGSSSTGAGASADSDNANHAGHGSYASASSVNKLPTTNSQASYKSVGMMIYHRPEAVLGRIMDYRVANSDAFGAGQGQGSDHLSSAASMSSVRDYFLGGGLPSEAIGFIAVSSASERSKAIAQLKSEGITQINGRPIEEIVILLSQASSMKPSDLPPVLPPANARPITDLPLSYDAPTAEVAA